MRFFLTLFTLAALGCAAQSKPDEAIQIPINNLFLAMEKGDSALLRTAFHTDLTMITVLEKEGKFTLRKETDIKGFATAVGTPHPDAWHEPIWDIKTEQDGNFAQVWAKYAMYIGTKFSHCGVDTFQLIKTDKGWKIFYLADTRQRVGCSVPAEIAQKYTTQK